jgi:hypothetical protein
MAMKMRFLCMATCVFGLIAGSAPSGLAQSSRLYAAGYYIAIDAVRDHEGVIRVRGGSNPASWRGNRP